MTSELSASTVGNWMESLHPKPPHALEQRMREALDIHKERPFNELPQSCLDAAQSVLARLLASGSTSRDSALDLLTADALVTCAFAVPSDTPELVLSQADSAMKTIASAAKL